MEGTIARKVDDRGFGFIKGNDGTDYFFHRSACESQIAFIQMRQGQVVSFDITSSDKGPRADNVRPVTVER